MSNETPIWLHIPDDMPDAMVDGLNNLSSTAQLFYIAALWQTRLTGNNRIPESEAHTLIERFLQGDRGHAFHRHAAPIEEQVN